VAPWYVLHHACRSFVRYFLNETASALFQNSACLHGFEALGVALRLIDQPMAECRYIIVMCLDMPGLCLVLVRNRVTTVDLADADVHSFGAKTAHEVFIFLHEQAAEVGLNMDDK